MPVIKLLSVQWFECIATSSIVINDNVPTTWLDCIPLVVLMPVTGLSTRMKKEYLIDQVSFEYMYTVDFINYPMCFNSSLLQYR